MIKYYCDKCKERITDTNMVKVQVQILEYDGGIEMYFNPYISDVLYYHENCWDKVQLLKNTFKL